MTAGKVALSNGQATEEPVPDLAGVAAKLDRVRVRAEHEVACAYVHEAHRLVYAVQLCGRDDRVTTALRREWLYAAAEFAERAAEYARTAAGLLTPPPGGVDGGQSFEEVW